MGGQKGEIVIGVIHSCQMIIFKTSDDETKPSQSQFIARSFQKHQDGVMSLLLFFSPSSDESRVLFQKLGLF